MQDYQLRQRDYLLEISRAMTSRLDLPSVLRLIIQNAVEMLSGQVGLIALRRGDGGFQIRASYGLSPHLLPLFAPLLTDIPHDNITGRPAGWQIPDLHLKLSLVTTAAGLNLRQVVALPMVMAESLIGVVYIFRSEGGAFSANDRQVLASFADQAAIAVRNATLYQQITAEKRLLDAIIDNSADGVMILDQECRILVFNRALSNLTGWSPKEAIGRSCRAVLSLHDRQGRDICQEECPLRGLAPDENLYVEGTLTREDGQVFTVGVTYTPLSNEEGLLLNIIANVNDITRFREAEEMKSTFVSIVSHELKTPVALIKGYAGTLRREDAQWDEETVREGLTIIEEESDRLVRLIDNLLEASRIQASGLKLEKSYFNLPKLAKKVVDGFRVQTEEHEFRLDFHPDFPLVYADQERLRQVLSNVVSNAVKYSPQGGTIRLGGRVDGHWATIYVADQGIGIPLGEQKHIFQRFYRVRSDLSHTTQGAGLGLYLCQAIVEAHGGRIWVESAPGKGAIFAFTLPLR